MGAALRWADSADAADTTTDSITFDHNNRMNRAKFRAQTVSAAILVAINL